MAKSRYCITVDPEVWEKVSSRLVYKESMSSKIEQLLKKLIGLDPASGVFDITEVYLNSRPIERKHLFNNLSSDILKWRLIESNKLWENWKEPEPTFMSNNSLNKFIDEFKPKFIIKEASRGKFNAVTEHLNIARDFLELAKSKDIPCKYYRLKMFGPYPKNEDEELYLYKMQEIRVILGESDDD